MTVTENCCPEKFGHLLFYIPLFLGLKSNKKREEKTEYKKEFEPSEHLDEIFWWNTFDSVFFPPLSLSIFLFCPIRPLPFPFLWRSSFHSYSSLSFPCFFSPRPPILGGNQSLRDFKLLMEGIRSYSSDVCRPVVSDRYRKGRGKSDIQPNLSTRISFFWWGGGRVFPTADSSCHSKCKHSSRTVREMFL